MEVVWERPVDLEKQRRSMKLFWLLYGVPAGLIIMVGGLIEGLGGAAGLLILLGGLGSMIFFTIWLMNRTRRTNTTISRQGGELVWATRRVRIDQIERFNVVMRQASMSMIGVTGSHTNAGADIGVAQFFLADGTQVEFVFGHLPHKDLDGLRHALESALPGLKASTGLHSS